MGLKDWFLKKGEKETDFTNFIKSVQNSSIKLLRNIEKIEKEKNSQIAAVQAHKERPELIEQLKKTIEDELEMIESLIKNYRSLTSPMNVWRVRRKMNRPGNEELTAAVLKLSDDARKVRDRLKQAKNSMQYGLRYLEQENVNRFLAEHQVEQKRTGDISNIVEDAAPNVALAAEKTKDSKIKKWYQSLTAKMSGYSRAAVLAIAVAGAMVSGCGTIPRVTQRDIYTAAGEAIVESIFKRSELQKLQKPGRFRTAFRRIYKKFDLFGKGAEYTFRYEERVVNGKNIDFAEYKKNGRIVLTEKYEDTDPTIIIFESKAFNDKEVNKNLKKKVERMKHYDFLEEAEGPHYKVLMR